MVKIANYYSVLCSFRELPLTQQELYFQAAFLWFRTSPEGIETIDQITTLSERHQQYEATALAFWLEYLEERESSTDWQEAEEMRLFDGQHRPAEAHTGSN